MVIGSLGTFVRVAWGNRPVFDAPASWACGAAGHWARGDAALGEMASALPEGSSLRADPAHLSAWTVAAGFCVCRCLYQR